MVLKLGHGDEYKARLADHEKGIYEQSTQKELGFRVNDLLTKTKIAKANDKTAKEEETYTVNKR